MPFKLTRTLNGLMLAGLIGLGATTALSILPAGAVPAGTPVPNGEIDPDSAIAQGGDPVRGKTVYQNVGRCVQCHGWGGDGTGSDPRSPGAAANLRETQLDTATLAEIIS